MFGFEIRYYCILLALIVQYSTVQSYIDIELRVAYHLYVCVINPFFKITLYIYIYIFINRLEIIILL